MRTLIIILSSAFLMACSGEYGDKVAVFSEYQGKAQTLESCKKSVYQKSNAVPSHVVSITSDTPKLFAGYYDPRAQGPNATLNTGVETKWPFKCEIVTDPSMANEYISVPYYDTSYFKWRGRD